MNYTSCISNTFEFSQSYNRYSYCMNNPFAFTDPSGNEYYENVVKWCNEQEYINKINGELHEKYNKNESWAKHQDDSQDGTFNNDLMTWMNISHSIGDFFRERYYKYPIRNDYNGNIFHHGDTVTFQLMVSPFQTDPHVFGIIDTSRGDGIRPLEKPNGGYMIAR